MRTTLIIIIALLINGCEQFDSPIDYRNYLRDKYPYSILEEKNKSSWHYIVRDTINGKNYFAIGNMHYSDEYLLDCN